MKRLLLLCAAAVPIVFAGCVTVGPVSDARIMNGLGRSDASYDANVVSNVLPSDAVVFYKSDLDSSYKKSVVNATTVSVVHLENLVNVEAKKFSLVTVEMLVSDPAKKIRVPSLTFSHDNSNEAISKDLEYYITFHNSGNVPVQTILFIDNLPDELTAQNVDSLSSVNNAGGWGGGSYDLGGIYVPLAPEKVRWDIKQDGGKRVIVIEINDPNGLPMGKSYSVRLRAHFDWPATLSSDAQQPSSTEGSDDAILVGTVRLDATNWNADLNGSHTSDLELTFTDLSNGQVLKVKSKGQDGVFSFAAVVGHDYQLTKIYYGSFSSYVYADKSASWVMTGHIKGGVNVLGHLHYETDKLASPRHRVTLQRDVDAVKQSFLAANPNSKWDAAAWDSDPGQ